MVLVLGLELFETVLVSAFHFLKGRSLLLCFSDVTVLHRSFVEAGQGHKSM